MLKIFTHSHSFAHKRDIFTIDVDCRLMLIDDRFLCIPFPENRYQTSNLTEFSENLKQTEDPLAIGPSINC